MPLPDRPLRFLHANTFYRRYVEDFYRSNPHLVEADYDQQISAFLQDGFASAHIFSEYLREFGIETLQVIDDNPISQSAWLRQNNFEISEVLDLDDAVRLQIETFKPDIFYTTNVTHFAADFIQKLNYRPTIISGWRGFPLPQGTDLREYDLILTSFDRIFEEASACGVENIVRFHPGFDESSPVIKGERDIKWDVVFSGTVTQEHRRRMSILEVIAQLSRDPIRPFSFGLFMPNVQWLPEHIQVLNQGARWANDMLHTLRNAQIVINIDIDAFDNQPPNMRLIEATGAGAFLITPYHPELKNFFEPGVEVETFRNENELITKILYFLDSPEQCQEIAYNGQQRCLRDHNQRSRAEWFRDIFLEAVERKLAD